MGAGGEAVLRVDHLGFRYRDRPEWALRDVSFEARAGEVLLVAGASGCGKTTLIRCLNGLIPRSYHGELEGQVHVRGQDTKGLSLAQISRLVGTVLQDPERQILGTKVLNEVAFGLENLGLSRAEILSTVDEALGRLGVLELRDRETFNLSGGEKQKVALAGVLAMRPQILLLDEPLASLDPASAEEALDLFRQLAGEGITLLIVEHRVEDVLRIRPDRVLFLEKGALEYDGGVEGMIAHVDYREVKLPAPLIIEQLAGPARRESPAGARTGATTKPPVAPGPAELESEEGASTPLVRFEDVSFGYEAGEPVLHDVSFEVHKGDVIAVLGPNGAGKTTLIKHAIGLLKPQEGHVLLGGRDTREMSVAEIAHQLGYVFQSPSAMLFAPTVEEEIAFGPKNIGHPDEEVAADAAQALRLLNLEGLEKYPPLSLSFGQQKRVSIASILAMRSRILVMDEPTAGQDFYNYTQFMRSIVALPAFDAVLFITHDIDLAVVFANRVLVVNDGRLAADGRPSDVLRDAAWLRAHRLVPTSLLRVNLALLPFTGGFLSAEQLAERILAGNVPWEAAEAQIERNTGLIGSSS